MKSRFFLVGVLFITLGAAIMAHAQGQGNQQPTIHGTAQTVDIGTPQTPNNQIQVSGQIGNINVEDVDNVTVEFERDMGGGL